MKEKPLDFHDIVCEGPELEYESLDRSIEALASARGCEIVLPAEDEIQLDLDGEQSYRNYIYLMDLFRHFEIANLKEIDQWTSGGGNRHVVVRIDRDITNLERVLLQALLGSDLKREVMNYGRVLKGLKNPITLFKPIKKRSIEEDSPFPDVPDDLPF